MQSVRTTVEFFKRCRNILRTHSLLVYAKQCSAALRWLPFRELLRRFQLHIYDTYLTSMDKRVAVTFVAVTVLVAMVLILILLVRYSRNQKSQARTAEKTAPEKVIRRRPSPLKLDDVRVKRLPAQLTPQHLIITPTTPNQFTIPSRPQLENYSRSTSLVASPDGTLRLSPISASLLPYKGSPTQSVKLLRTMSEGYGSRFVERRVTPHGKIECFLKHDEKRNSLFIKILGKKGHSLSWLTGISNPYIRVTLISNQQGEPNCDASSQILNLPLNPECQLDGITKEDLKDCLLKFVILDFDRFSRSEFVAEVLVSLGELENLNDGVIVCEDLMAQQKVMFAPRGSLLISLCNQSVAQQLQVIILKADGISSKIPVSLTGSDITVRTTLETSEACQARKSKGLRKNASYVFNEKLVFEVSSEELTNASLAFEVTRGDSRLLNETKIGFVKLGLNSSQALEIRHWSEMLASPQKQIAEWHQLRR